MRGLKVKLNLVLKFPSMILFNDEIAFQMQFYLSMQLSQTIKIKEIELIIQTAFKLCICLQIIRKFQFGVMVECLFTNWV